MESPLSMNCAGGQGVDFAAVALRTLAIQALATESWVCRLLTWAAEAEDCAASQLGLQ
jgi:hypothetical protein